MSISDPIEHPRILALGAHPDDCDVQAGGCAVLWAQAGCSVRFVSVTNGDAGHHEMAGQELVDRRTAEAEAAGRVAGIEYLVMDNHDGQLVPGLVERNKLMRVIREFRPDLMLTHRPNDYHPDHRYTSQLVQDCSFLVGVPNICPETPPLETMPVIAYFSDDFQKPLPFQPDVAVDIDSVIDIKTRMLDCHVSQVYEWLPWIGQHDMKIPENPEERLEVLKQFVVTFSRPDDKARASLIRTYGEEHGAAVENAERFEACEYGSPLDEAAIKRLFPFLP
jgi:LmbE family N-acetylglucosaminyl deacetylase